MFYNERKLFMSKQQGGQGIKGLDFENEVSKASTSRIYRTGVYNLILAP